MPLISGVYHSFYCFITILIQFMESYIVLCLVGVRNPLEVMFIPLISPLQQLQKHIMSMNSNSVCLCNIVCVCVFELNQLFFWTVFCVRKKKHTTVSVCCEKLCCAAYCAGYGFFFLQGFPILKLASTSFIICMLFMK